MLSLFSKYIIKFTAATVILINLFQLITVPTSTITIYSENLVSRETRLIETIVFHSSPGKLENNLKKFERTTDKPVSEFKSLGNEKFIYTDDFERYVRAKLLWLINITNDINFIQSVTNDIDPRGPPLSLS